MATTDWPRSLLMNGFVLNGSRSSMCSPVPMNITGLWVAATLDTVSLHSDCTVSIHKQVNHAKHQRSQGPSSNIPYIHQSSVCLSKDLVHLQHLPMLVSCSLQLCLSVPPGHKSWCVQSIKCHPFVVHLSICCPFICLFVWQSGSYQSDCLHVSHWFIPSISDKRTLLITYMSVSNRKYYSVPWQHLRVRLNTMFRTSGLLQVYNILSYTCSLSHRGHFTDIVVISYRLEHIVLQTKQRKKEKPYVDPKGPVC